MATTVQRLRMGMVGGGPGAFIGDVHRRAACIDGDVALVAGAFASDAARSRQKGTELGLSPDRAYASYAAMVDGERALPAGDRIDFVSIVTPEPRPFPRREEVPRGGVPRRLRQADDVHGGRGARAATDRAEEPPRLRPDPQLHRLSDGEAGPRPRAGGRPRPAAQGGRRVPAGLARHPPRADGHEAGRMAHRPAA